MKVSVAFGDKRVVVPCKDGSLTIRELIDEATRRYKKTNCVKVEDASSLSIVEAPDINVFGIESLDGAIYDLDDRVCDVADDKETLVALFHESANSLGLVGGGGCGDCGSSGDGGNSSEHFTSSITNDHTPSYNTHVPSDGGRHLGVLRTKSEEFLNKQPLTTVTNDNRRLLHVAPSPPTRKVYNHNFDEEPPSPSNNRNSTPEHLNSNSSTNKSFNRNKSHISNSHTDGDLKQLASQIHTKQQDSPSPNSQPQMFRRTFGSEAASPRQTATSNSDMIDRWMTTHILKDDNVVFAYNNNNNNSISFNKINNNFIDDDSYDKEYNVRGNNDLSVKSREKPSFDEIRSSFDRSSVNTNPSTNNNSSNHPVTTNTATGGIVSSHGNRVINVSGGGGTIEHRIVTIENDDRPLGIQVVAQTDKRKQFISANGVSNNDLCVKNISIGLLVRCVNKGAKAEQSGILFPNDLITEINGKSLYGLTFETSQQIFKNALQAPTLTLRIVNSNSSLIAGTESQSKAAINSFNQSPAPISSSTSTSVSLTPASSNHESARPPGTTHFFPLPNPQQPTHSVQQNPIPAKAHVSSNGYSTLPIRGSKSLRPEQAEIGGDSNQRRNVDYDGSTPPVEMSNKTFYFDSPLSLMGRANTKKIGRKIRVQLIKGADGLGFSITQRDNFGPSNSVSPIYIKKILPKGAAIHDGRLMEGDRILEVNGKIVTGMSQSEVVAFLRSIEENRVADILVSRHEVEDIPREIPNNNEFLNNNEELFGTDWKTAQLPTDNQQPSFRRSILSFEIPLNDTGSAGLGISVKGRTQKDLSTNISRDTGVFVKAVMNGGAACKDGRLRVNDQLLTVNNESLEGLDNKEAIDVLKNALLQHGKSGLASLRVTVARLEPSKGIEDVDCGVMSGRHRSSYRADCSMLSMGDETGSVDDAPRHNDSVSTNEANGETEFGFCREDVHRRSLSEKRTGPGGKTRDANELAFYREKIKPLKDARVGAQSGQTTMVPRSASVESLNRIPHQQTQNPFQSYRTDVVHHSYEQRAAQPSSTLHSNQYSNVSSKPGTPPPVPVRRSRPPSSGSQYNDEQLATAAVQNKNIDLGKDNRSNFEIHLASISNSGKEKKSKSGGIFRGLFRSANKKGESKDVDQNGGNSRSTSVPMRPNSAMPLPAHRFNNNSTTSNNSNSSSANVTSYQLAANTHQNSLPPHKQIINPHLVTAREM